MKNFKRILASAFAGLVAVSAISTVAPVTAQAAEESTESYELFIAFGGDAAEENDWGLSYAGGDASEGITATNATIASGETATVKLEFANPVVNAWYFAPTMVAEGVVDADFTVQCFIDGEEVAVDMAAGDNWWYEETGDYSKEQAVRIAGGFNEWAAQYIAEPAGFTTLEYVITANSIKTGELEVTGTESTEEYDVFLAFGGDAVDENDWGLAYTGEAADGITAVDGKIKSGETTTISLTFDNPVVNAWYFAPTMIAENVVAADFTVQCFIDGEEVAVDMAAGDNWWYEGTGSYDNTQAVRIAGGYNEWGAQYIAEPAGFTTLEYVITANSIMVGEADAGFVSAAGPVDLDGVYHAYLGIQGPKYSFRDGWDNASTGGINNSPLFNQVTFQGDVTEGASVPATINDVEIAGNGTYTVSITGIEWPEDEFSDQDYMNLILVSTDIPNTAEITFDSITLNVDGTEVSVNPMLQEEVDYMTYQLQNIWVSDIAAIGYYPTPFSDISITFTVSGFNYDCAAAPADDTAAPADDTAAPADDTAAPAEDGTTTDAEGGLSTGAIAGIIGGVVVVAGAGIGIGVNSKKKKEGKDGESK